MQRSDSIRELVGALAKARQNFKPIHKEMENPQYRSKVRGPFSHHRGHPAIAQCQWSSRHSGSRLHG